MGVAHRCSLYFPPLYINKAKIYKKMAILNKIFFFVKFFLNHIDK